MTPMRPLSLVLSEYAETLDAETVSIGALINAFHERGFGILSLLFALPVITPIPVLNTVFATPLLVLTAQQAFGAHAVWMPQRLRQKKVPAARLKNLLIRSASKLRILEKLIRPRLGWATQNGFSRFFGFLAFLMTMVAVIPVPLTHTVPGLGIALMAIGTAMRDGLAVLIGAIIGTGWIVMLGTALALFGPEAFDFIVHTIKSVL
jgi:hypothetical protein